MEEFQQFCRFPVVASAIDRTHIRKPYVGPEDYFYFKSSRYTIQMQAVVDRNKRFLDIAIGVLKNIYDSYMPFFPIPASFFDPAIFEDGFSSFLIRFVLEHLFNRKLFYGRSMVKNAF
jgi:hypothetical protein